jgi:hypothetical protein
MYTRVLSNSGHVKLSSRTNSNSQLGQPIKKDEWRSSNLPVNNEQELQNLYTKMTVLNYNEQDNLVRHFKYSLILKLFKPKICKHYYFYFL